VEGEVVGARTAVAVSFALAGVVFATWASRIPDVTHALGLGPSGLGLLLLCGSAGSVLALPLTGWVSAHLGTARTVLLGSITALGGMTVSGVAVGVLHSTVVTAVSLFVTMAGVGGWDVAMNLEGTRVEQALGRALMPRLHAAFSLGTVGGALLGTGATYVAVPVAAHLALVAGLAVLVTLWSVRRFIPEPAQSASDARGRPPRHLMARSLRAWRERRTIAIGLVVLVAAFTEGTANDWLALALVKGYAMPAWAGSLALATFLASMTAGRLAGTALLDRFGRVRVVGATLALAVVGAVLVSVGPVPVAYLGAAVWGLGASLGFPVGMSAAADDPEHAAARVSVVASIGYVAFLAGPPLVGLVGEHLGVLRAVTAVGLVAAPALLVLGALRAPVGADPGH
jgi:MFS family permease